jgi:hypothetical protein
MASPRSILFSQTFRIFGIPVALTLAIFMLVGGYLGPAALLLTLILCVIEITFSFDNAIVDARILRHMSEAWQRVFLTVGVLIGVVGMRLVFPIAIVALTAQLDWQTVLNLALNEPEEYSEALDRAHPLIASFGGSFLLMLGLHFFLDKSRDVYWLPFERIISRAGSWWAPMTLALLITTVLALLPNHHDPIPTAYAGIAGIFSFLIIHGLSETVGRNKALTSNAKKTGIAAFVSFLYLEMLDASFSFDSVIGAFAITSDVIIIAVGLGIGALWVRTLTVYMVRREVLDNYKYLDHGAHYTILILASTFLASLFFDVPEAIPGLLGIGVIVTSIIASRKEK